MQRTLRRIELTKRVCGVPYAAHSFHVVTSARLHLLPFASYVSWCVPYRVAVIHSKARGWPVQRSLPRVTIRGRKLPPWGGTLSHAQREGGITSPPQKHRCLEIDESTDTLTNITYHIFNECKRILTSNTT